MNRLVEKKSDKQKQTGRKRPRKVEVAICRLACSSPLFRYSLSLRTERLASDEMDILILKGCPALERYWVIF